MPDQRLGLFWKSEEVAKAMLDNGIRRRWQLAERLEEMFGIGQATVYRMFNEKWEGKTTGEFLDAVSRLLRVPFHRLITDPNDERNCA